MKYKYNGQWYDLTLPAFDSLPVGAIIGWTSSTIPSGYLLCNGQAVSRTTYASLFSVIETTYGTGDGSTTFNLPNIKGRTIVGLDSTQTEFDTLGETGGSKYLQDHYHKGASLGGNDLTSWSTTGSGGIFDLSSIFKSNQPNNNKLDIGGVDTGATPVGDSGNLQPYIVVNYIIKAHPSAVNTSEVQNTQTTSETDTYSCTYVNIELDKNKWQTLGTINNVGQGYALNIPSGAKELNIDCFDNRDDGASLNILTSNLSSNSKGYDGGFYKNSNDMLRVLIYATSSKVWVQEFVQNGSSKSSLSVGCTINYK